MAKHRGRCRMDLVAVAGKKTEDLHPRQDAPEDREGGKDWRPRGNHLDQRLVNRSSNPYDVPKATAFPG